MKLSDDKKSVSLSINGEFSANELLALISELGFVRREMIPEVAYEHPADEEICSIQDDPALFFGAFGDYIALGLRDSGHGWMVFNFPHDQACNIRDLFIANTQPGTSELFSEDGSGNLPN